MTYVFTFIEARPNARGATSHRSSDVIDSDLSVLRNTFTRIDNPSVIAGEQLSERSKVHDGGEWLYCYSLLNMSPSLKNKLSIPSAKA